MKASLDLIDQQSAPAHRLDAIDTQAIDAAEQYCKQHGPEIREQKVESATRLFDMLAETYQQRMVHHRIEYGDEFIEATYIATRTPDTTEIDELYSEYVVYNHNAGMKQPVIDHQRIVTMYDGQGGYTRIVLSEDALQVVDHSGEEITGDGVETALMDFAFRTNQAIATYQHRTANEQAFADWDAKQKFEKRLF